LRPAESLPDRWRKAACASPAGGRDRESADKLAEFERAILGCEKVMECYLMTGAFDYVIRVVANDIPGIERFVITRLATIAGVRDVSTSITLRRVQYKTELPVRQGEA
jgi:Lrp/AsnC family transcriptional regulator, leucine-responsive regulatory protein